MTHAILILVDALRADHLGCYAGEDLGTPNMDLLAQQGIVFENAISQGSWTRPSTASMMTGLYPSQNGVGSRWSKTDEGRLSARSLDPSIPTLAEILTAGGYTTAFMGGNAILKPLFGVTRGFTHNLWRSIANDGAVIVEDFERWMQTERPKSSFCYMHFMDVHKPLPMETISARLDTGLDLDLVHESKNELMSYYGCRPTGRSAYRGGYWHSGNSGNARGHPDHLQRRPWRGVGGARRNALPRTYPVQGTAARPAYRAIARTGFRPREDRPTGSVDRLHAHHPRLSAVPAHGRAGTESSHLDPGGGDGESRRLQRARETGSIQSVGDDPDAPAYPKLSARKYPPRLPGGPATRSFRGSQVATGPGGALHTDQNNDTAGGPADAERDGGSGGCRKQLGYADGHYLPDQRRHQVRRQGGQWALDL